MPNPLLLTIHDSVNTALSSNWLRSTSATSILYSPEEESSFKATRFLTPMSHLD
jgi:hypothetical protein